MEGIEITTSWEQASPTGQPCDVCKEPVYGKMYVLHVCGEPINTVVCESCYMEAYKDEKKV